MFCSRGFFCEYGTPDALFLLDDTFWKADIQGSLCLAIHNVSGILQRNGEAVLCEEKTLFVCLYMRKNGQSPANNGKTHVRGALFMTFLREDVFPLTVSRLFF